MANQPLIIKDWENGIAPSPHKGFGLIRNADIFTFPGSVRTGRKPQSKFHTAYSSTFTADAGTDVCTSSATVPATGTAVTLTTTGTLPAGLATSTTYFIINVSTTTFKLATNLTNANASTAINITDAGSGTHTVTTTNPGTINHIIRDPRNGYIFAHDSNGRVWTLGINSNFVLLSGNTLTASSGNGICLFRVSDGSATYLFVFRNNAIDVANVFGDSQIGNPTWSNAWQTMNTTAGTSNSHHAIVGQDNIVYFCDGRYVGSIRENSGSVFDPATGGTYTYNNQALDLPADEIAYWLEEIGTKLLISGQNFNKIYPWDRLSDSYNLPLPVPESNVYRMKNAGNVVYIQAGSKGNIYQTQGTYVREFVSIPEYLTNNAGTILSNPITWGGIASCVGKLLVGVGANVTTANSGVYAISLDGRISIDAIPSSGATNVTAISAITDFYTYGYSGGADNFGNATYYSSFEAVVQSPLYIVGTKIQKGFFSRLEVKIAKPVSGGNIRVSYRTDITSSFTTIDTFVTDSSNISYSSETIGLIDLENIQIQVEMDGNVELMEVRLEP